MCVACDGIYLNKIYIESLMSTESIHGKQGMQSYGLSLAFMYSQLPIKHTRMITSNQFCQPHIFLITNHRDWTLVPNAWKLPHDRFKYQ